MLAAEKLHKAQQAINQALENLEQENKRLAVGALDHAKDDILAGIYILIEEIKEEEGRF